MLCYALSVAYKNIVKFNRKNMSCNYVHVCVYVFYMYLSHLFRIELSPLHYSPRDPGE